MAAIVICEKRAPSLGVTMLAQASVQLARFHSGLADYKAMSFRRQINTHIVVDSFVDSAFA